MFTECDGVCSNTTRRRSQWEHVGYSAMLYLRLSMEEFDSSKGLLIPGADDLGPLASSVLRAFSLGSGGSGRRTPRRQRTARSGWLCTAMSFVRVDFTDYAQTIDTFFGALNPRMRREFERRAQSAAQTLLRRMALPDRDRRHQVQRGEGHPVHYRALGNGATLVSTYALGTMTFGEGR